MPRIDLQQPLLKPDVQIAQSPIHRYGVFATRDYKPEELIEECPVIIHDSKDTGLTDYVFDWEEQLAFATGYGSMYNHSPEPNAYYSPDRTRELFIFRAQQTIKAGEEIFVDYSPKWFITRDKIPLVLVEPKRRFKIPYLFEIFMISIAVFTLFFIK